MRTAILASGIILALSSASIAMPFAPPFAPSNAMPVHGCHHYYAHDISGWHRHDETCSTLRGMVGGKNKNPVKS
jgi:hypothetical protein